MSGVLALCIVALAAAALAALGSGVVTLHRSGALGVRRGLAVGALAVAAGAVATLGVAAVAGVPASPAVADVVVVDQAAADQPDSPADAEVTSGIQLETLALDE